MWGCGGGGLGRADERAGERGTERGV
jgi:hypothetical protein